MDQDTGENLEQVITGMYHRRGGDEGETYKKESEL